MQISEYISHKAFGAAELVEYTNGYVTLFFPHRNEQKKFGLLQSLVGGFIKISFRIETISFSIKWLDRSMNNGLDKSDRNL